MDFNKNTNNKRSSEEDYTQASPSLVLANKSNSPKYSAKESCDDLALHEPFHAVEVTHVLFL